jgi:hypothetical protein
MTLGWYRAPLELEDRCRRLTRGDSGHERGKEEHEHAASHGRDVT